MLGAADILDGLSAITSQATLVAVASHILIGTALLALLGGWRPSQRTARLLIGLPLASVAAVAIAFANPLNGLLFTGPPTSRWTPLVKGGPAIRRDRAPRARLAECSPARAALGLHAYGATQGGIGDRVRDVPILGVRTKMELIRRVS